jgi:hypothetical protein
VVRSEPGGFARGLAKQERLKAEITAQPHRRNSTSRPCSSINRSVRSGASGAGNSVEIQKMCREADKRSNLLP